ncbi:MAG TPA: cytochrome c, partial [Niabella sp.]|nr:cytochrome c [Niabella sp.]
MRFMNNHKYFFHKLTLLTITLLLTITSVWAQESADLEDGKKLFMTNCASCHNGDMKTDMTGPALGGVQAQWPDQKKLHEWVSNNLALAASVTRSPSSRMCVAYTPL